MKQKNVVLILADQLRKDTLGCYGNDLVRTPNIDRLASHGVKFNRAYVANPICMPNRLSIFTGMYPNNHGLWTNGLLLKNERHTIANHLKENGYTTASFGKVHFEPTGCDIDYGSRESSEYWEMKKNEIEPLENYWGFDHVELTIGHSTNPLAHYGKWFRENGGKDSMLEKDNNGCTMMPSRLHDSAFVGDRVSSYILNERDSNKPFFVVASFSDPHHPFNPPREALSRYTYDVAKEPIGNCEDLKNRPKHYFQHYLGKWHRKGEIENKNGIADLSERNRRIVNTYAMVDLIDENVGRIIESLESANLMDDTIIIFTSDHGELLGDHGLWYKGPFYFEGLINVPLIIYSKDNSESFESDNLISSVDIMPTLCNLLDLEIPIYVNGVSQLPHLKNKEKVIRDSCLISYRNGYGENDVASFSLVKKDLKFVKYETGECELTDLKNDPFETKNLIDDTIKSKEIEKQMSMQLLDEIIKNLPKHPKQISHA